ncbi:MAG: translation elongation factor Ts [Oscillospiraceae bacterium]|jgi:elongation factor Ts|nr:translation elongation factor Ts [Oscillospiraceae bacterium]
MSFAAKDVLKLREKTGCGMMDCKKALTEADGAMDRAIEILREKGIAVAAKKAGRIAAEGIVAAATKANVGVLIEVNSETDFVAKNKKFIEFVDACAKAVADQNPPDVEALLACSLGAQTVDEALKEKVLVIGENLKIRRFARFEGITHSYIHGDGRIGVLVAFDVEKDAVVSLELFKELSKDIAMQIAASNPLWLSKSDVAPDVLERERQILMNQAKNEGKPENVAIKMVEGRIAKYYRASCLLEQEFIKDPETNVAKYIDSVAEKLGAKIRVLKFARFERGEGIEKKGDNLADEVAGMLS